MRRLQFKFPSQIRISGWDFGSSARAMNQAGGKDALMTYESVSFAQAELGKGLNSTTERKSMSTKTTIKRIALVAVSALGLGLVTTVSATAATVTEGATASLSTQTSSITLIDSAANADTTYGVFEVSLTNTSGIAGRLQKNETLTATVIANPQPNRPSTATLNTDLKLQWATAYAADTGAITSAQTGGNGTDSYAGGTAGAAAFASDNVEGQAFSNLDLKGYKRGGTTATQPATAYTSSTSTATATYALKVSSRSVNTKDSGAYQIRISVVDSNGNAINSKIVKFSVASSKLTSGAVLTVTPAGPQPKGAAVLATTSQNITATVTDAYGGLIREGANTYASLSATIKDAGSSATPAVYTSTSVTLTDAGVDASAAAATDVAQVALDGTFEVTSGSTPNGVAGAGTITVRYGDSSATSAITILGADSDYAYTSVSATGKVASSTDYLLPLTTKSATISVVALDANSKTTGVAVTGKTLYYTLSYSGCVTADVAPVKATAPTKIVTDASGVASITITNANPNNNCAATVTFTGATVVTNDVLARTVTWKAPVATTVISDPSAGYQALTASTNKVTWTVLDQFSQPVVGKTVTFTMSGANKPTAGLASQVTDAKGQVSYSWTDAKAVAGDATLGSDTVAVATVGADTPSTLGSVTVTYKTALSVVSTIKAYYGTASGSETIVVPATNIGGSTGKLISANDQLDQTKPITTAANPGAVFVKFSPVTSADVAVSGIPMTVTVTGPAKILDAAGYLTSSRTVYASTAFTVVGTGTGVATVTATSGTVTKSATINFVNADTDARVLSATESNGTITATVKDFSGSPVAGVTVSVALAGTGRLGNGASSGTFVTAADGTVSFDVNSAATATISLSSTYTKASFLANAGDATGAVVTTGAPAGVRSVSIETAGGASSSTAVDAANEATDAANAATDAANAAAEAADAATAAAQDAQAAVAALATQVASLIAGIKAQITTLTNLVIKIQKKVRA